MSVCYIFAAGSYYGLPERPGPGDTVIAADAGYAACHREGLRPDLVVGDFDSSSPPAGEKLLRLPVEKDDTDTLRALREGLALGCRDFVIYGGTGGTRPDHTLANLQCLLFLASHGARGKMYGDGVLWQTVCRERIDFPAGKRGTLSLFCLGEEARGVCLRGLKYELENGTLRADFPLGVSNSFTGRAASVSLREGCLLMMTELTEEEA